MSDDTNWIPQSKLVERLQKTGRFRKPPIINLDSPEAKVRYLHKLTDEFKKEWDKTNERKA
tara:strand:+ start:467 stop:649 length:183 start_codon:yes stop_codon:yes gene_type:complete